MTNDKSRAGAATAAMAAVLLWAPLGSAQEDESERAPQFEGPLAEQLEEYWSTDRKLPDLYYKRYEKAGRVELGVHAGALPSEPFHVYIPLGGSVGYYWSESMGVEVGGAGLLRTNTDLSDFLEGELGDAYAPDRVGEDVYQTTFARLLSDDPNAPRGRRAVGGDKPVGLVHYFYHPHAWKIAPVCYLQDLFADPEVRGQGIGRKLIDTVYHLAAARGAANVY